MDCRSLLPPIARLIARYALAKWHAVLDLAGRWVPVIAYVIGTFDDLS